MEHNPAGHGKLSRRDALRLGALAGSGLVVGPAFLAACASENSPSTRPTGSENSPSTRPTRGGILTAGLTGGSASDNLDAHAPSGVPSVARAHILYETLVTRNSDYELELALAEEITPSNNGARWTIRLRDGLTFHNGKAVTADDVIFSIRRIVDPEDPKNESQSLAFVDPNGMRKIDERTVQLDLKTPTGYLVDALAGYAAGIVPTDYDPKNPVGAGAFKFEAYSPGDRSTFSRFDGYWREGEPHLDELVLVDFPDDSARVNAFLSGQVDCIDQVPANQIGAVDGAGLKLLVAPSGNWIPFTMRLDVAPYTDVRVRQAIRLMVDREQMVEQVLSGRGELGNDLYAPLDPAYNSELPQRQYDLDQAKSLLRQAGAEDLRIEVITSPVAAGAVEAATVFKQQAQAAGASVKLTQVPADGFWDKWLSYEFSQGVWNTRPYLAQAARCALKSSPFNETHFSDPKFASLIQDAFATLDDAKRVDYIHAAQEIEYNTGGYVVWGFPDQLSGVSPKVQGFESDRSGNPLNSYRFRSVWLA